MCAHSQKGKQTLGLPAWHLISRCRCRLAVLMEVNVKVVEVYVNTTNEVEVLEEVLGIVDVVKLVVLDVVVDDDVQVFEDGLVDVDGVVTMCLNSSMPTSWTMLMCSKKYSA
eukprot:830547-Amphidinium_carterae.1